MKAQAEELHIGNFKPKLLNHNLKKWSDGEQTSLYEQPTQQSIKIRKKDIVTAKEPLFSAESLYKKSLTQRLTQVLRGSDISGL